MFKKTQPTGVVPVDADHDRWAYMRDGRVIWAGGREECERRWRLTMPEPAADGAFMIGRAIRAI